MPKPFDEELETDDWEERRRQVIGLGGNSVRKNYYPQLRRNIANVKNLVLAVEQSSRGIFIGIRNGAIEYVNSTLATLTGCDSEALIGHTPCALWSNAIAGDGCEAVMPAIAAGSSWKGDFCLKGQAGEEVWVNLSIAPIRDDTGDITHFLGNMEDISARKRVEDELKAVALARAKALETAELLSALKSQFIANMSHELRTPIFQILGLARMGARAPDLDKARLHAQRIGEAGDRLMQIVSSVLDFAAVESGRLEVTRAHFAVQDMIGELADKWRPRVEAKGLSFELRAASEARLAINGDRKRLQQVIDELLANAVKFTRQGGIVLSVRNTANDIDFTVSDTGIGMSAEQVEAGMQPFQQLDGSQARHHGGMGLGLALVKPLVALMGGRLQVDSVLDAGTTIQVSVPIN